MVTKPCQTRLHAGFKALGSCGTEPMDAPDRQRVHACRSWCGHYGCCILSLILPLIKAFAQRHVDCSEWWIAPSARFCGFAPCTCTHCLHAKGKPRQHVAVCCRRKPHALGSAKCSLTEQGHGPACTHIQGTFCSCNHRFRFQFRDESWKKKKKNNNNNKRASQKNKYNKNHQCADRSAKKEKKSGKRVLGESDVFRKDMTDTGTSTGRL